MPIEVISEELNDDVDELLSQRDYRLDEQGRGQALPGALKKDEARHPTRRLTIVGDAVIRPERLLFKIQMPREEFSRVIEIILMRICKCLHTDVNKSCFTLRMIFYKNLCGVLDHLVPFLSQNVIFEIFSYLVRPLQ